MPVLIENVCHAPSSVASPSSEFTSHHLLSQEPQKKPPYGRRRVQPHLWILVAVAAGVGSALGGPKPQDLLYVAPLPGATLVRPETNIIVRWRDISAGDFRGEGEQKW